jgi:hypothetical protein
MTMELKYVLIALVVSSSIGIIAGLYPAWKAPGRPDRCLVAVDGADILVRDLLVVFADTDVRVPL